MQIAETADRKVTKIDYDEHVKRFLLYYAAISAAMTVIALIVGNGWGPVLVTPFFYQSMYSSYLAGLHFAKKEGRMPEPGETWRLCRRFVLVGYPVAVFCILVYASDASLSGFMRLYGFYADRGELLILIAFMFIFSLGVAFANLIVMRLVFPSSVSRSLSRKARDGR